MSRHMLTSHRATGSLALLTLVIGFGACKDESVAVDGYVDSYSERVCTAVLECDCDYPGGSDFDHCVSQLSVGAKTLAELLDVEGLSFDGGCAERQVDEVGRLGCGVPMLDPDAECEAPCKVFYGPVHAGGTCSTVNGFDNCNQGLTCNGNVCVHPCAEPDLPRLGEACSTDFGCDEGFWCDGISTPLLPVCDNLPQVGDECLPAEFGFACAEDLICDTSDPDSPTCAELPGEGEECPAGACADDLHCDTSEVPAVCITLPSVGELCPLGLCAAPNLCEQGLCVDPRPQVCGLYGGVPEGLAGGESTGGGITTIGDETGAADSTGLGDETGTGGTASNCCEIHDTPACDDISVATCVCEIEPTCCSEPWLAGCVELVTAGGCGSC